MTNQAGIEIAAACGGVVAVGVVVYTWAKVIAILSEPVWDAVVGASSWTSNVVQRVGPTARFKWSQRQERV